MAATNRANGAPDHAKLVAALAAAGGHEIAVKAQPFAHQPCDAVMRLGDGERLAAGLTAEALGPRLRRGGI